ncbi:hypothetical protein WT02_16715 [Burkholderia stagnalis]|nr:hypothetical protein WT03_02085 [Burkholderia stagnalis]KVL95603.1 hypothetical protein WT02_16715 [Burkholderia stagnalis]KVM14814.1 hypothetical protein WT04_07420 [Burkholderia stagnalis]
MTAVTTSVPKSLKNCTNLSILPKSSASLGSASTLLTKSRCKFDSMFLTCSVQSRSDWLYTAA